MVNKKIFVISDERCGGTQLGNMFQIMGHSRIDDPQTMNKNRNTKINTKNYLLKNFTYFAKNYEYIKVCTKSFSTSQYKTLINDAKKNGFEFIFLWRKNFLQRALSRAIAGETGCWSFSSINDKWKHKFKIDENVIGKEIKENKERTIKIKKYLKDNKIDHFDLEYSKLYGSNMNISQRYSYFKIMVDGFDKTLLDAKKPNVIKKVKEKLSPSQRINTSNTYKRITNINEILKKFSNEENGIVKL
jgi:hypothetical protein